MDFITLKNEKMEVTLCSLGASIFRLLFDDVDMVLSPIKKEDFSQSEIYFGKTVGLICGRVIRNNKIILHGGSHGLSKQTFDYIKEDNKVIFIYLSKGDESLPNVEALIKITYELKDEELIIYTEITPKATMSPYLTNHSYFCLGEDDIANLSLKFDADKYVTYNEKLLPEGYQKVNGKYDFSKLTNVMKYGEIDNFFFVNKVILQSNKYQLEVITNFEGMQIYSDYFTDEVVTQLTNKNSHRALAIEPQDDKLESRAVPANKTYQRVSKYIFKKI